MTEMSKKRRGKSKMNPQENPQEVLPEEEAVLEAEDPPEEENAGTEEEQPPKKTELQIAEEKTAEYLALAQRVQADFENFRRRNESVRADSFAEGKRDVAAAMLPVLDNLERAAEAAENSADEAMKSGVGLVLKQMTEVYRKLGVTPIDRVGEKFDPNLENAILQGTEEDGEPGTVCQVLQKGYRMGDRVIRHAMVKVVPE